MTKIGNITELWGFHDGLASFHIHKGRRTLEGMINTAGEIVVEPKYHRIYTKVGDIICIKKTEKSKCSYIDIVCNRIIYNTDEIGQEVANKRIITKSEKNNRYGLEDFDRNVIIPHQFAGKVSQDHFLYVRPSSLSFQKNTVRFTLPNTLAGTRSFLWRAVRFRRIRWRAEARTGRGYPPGVSGST